MQVSKGLESVQLTSQGLHMAQWNIVMAFLKQRVSTMLLGQALIVGVFSSYEFGKESLGAI